jgi:hypothetical protein
MRFVADFLDFELEVIAVHRHFITALAGVSTIPPNPTRLSLPFSESNSIRAEHLDADQAPSFSNCVCSLHHFERLPFWASQYSVTLRFKLLLTWYVSTTLRAPYSIPLSDGNRHNFVGAMRDVVESPRCFQIVSIVAQPSFGR